MPASVEAGGPVARGLVDDGFTRRRGHRGRRPDGGARRGARRPGPGRRTPEHRGGVASGAGVVAERRAQAFTDAVDRAECGGNRLGEDPPSGVGGMQAVAAQHAGRLRDGLPVEHRDVVAFGAQTVDDLVDLHVVGSVLRHGEQQRGARGQPVEDADQFGLVPHLVAAVVAAEEDHRRVPVLLGRRIVEQQLVEHAVAEVDEAARLGFDGDLPAERHDRLTHVVAVTRRRGREDRVADHQDPVALGDLADQLCLGAVGVDRRANHHDRLANRRRSDRHQADTGDGRHRRGRWERVAAVVARRTAARGHDGQRSEDGKAPAGHLLH